MAFLNANKLPFRCLMLILANFCPLGSNTVKDSYAVLQPVLSKAPNCSTDDVSISCCSDCLGIGDQNYNIMFSMIFWTSTITVLFAGYLMDKYGNAMIILFTVSNLIGTCLIAIGGSLRQSGVTLALTMVGSFFIGICVNAVLMAREKIVAVWFPKSHMGLGMGLTFCFARIAAALMFFTTEPIREAVGLQWTLWIINLWSLLAVLCAVCVSLLDFYGNQQLELEDSVQAEQKSVRVTDLCKMNFEYWIIIGIFATANSTQNVLQSNGIEFVHEKFGFSKQSAAMIGGCICYGGLLGPPIVGMLLDKFGRVAIFLMVFSGITPPFIALLAFTSLYPLVPGTLFSTAYSSLQAMWASAVVAVVPKATVGTALAFSYCASGLYGSILYVISGRILGNELRLALSEKLHRWNLFMIAMIISYSLSFVLSVVLTVGGFVRDSRVVKAKVKSADYEELKYTDATHTTDTTDAKIYSIKKEKK